MLTRLLNALRPRCGACDLPPHLRRDIGLEAHALCRPSRVDPHRFQAEGRP